MFLSALSLLSFILWTSPVWAASGPPETPPQALLWSYLAGGLAFLVPVAIVFWVVSGLEPDDARPAALLVPVTVAAVALAYAAVGFALEFGGVGLMDARHGFSRLVWEWSALPEQWGPYWGMAGFAGWFLGGGAGTPEAVALFWGHFAWVLVAALIPVLVMRRQVPRLYPLLIALLMAGGVVPVAGNWVHGGGWLARLGATLGWGHGYVDVGGSGLVGLVGGGMGLALLLAFRLTRGPEEPKGELPPVHLPLLAAGGSLFLVVAAAGWALNNPLYSLNTMPLHRILTNALLGMAGGAALPAFYIWFVTDAHHPHFALAGAFAGWLSVLAGLPFLPAPFALLTGTVVGFLVPFAVYAVREWARLDDPAGLVTASLLGGTAGPLAVGLFADGRYGQGWNGIGSQRYLGVSGQGVSGFFVAPGFTPDWPGQMQAQAVGVAAHFLWAFVIGSVVGVALALLWWAVRRVLSTQALRRDAQEGPQDVADEEADGRYSQADEGHFPELVPEVQIPGHRDVIVEEGDDEHGENQSDAHADDIVA